MAAVDLVPTYGEGTETNTFDGPDGVVKRMC